MNYSSRETSVELSESSSSVDQRSKIVVDNNGDSDMDIDEALVEAISDVNDDNEDQEIDENLNLLPKKNKYRVYPKHNDFTKLMQNFQYLKFAREWVNDEVESMNSKFIKDAPAINVRDGESILKWKGIIEKIFNHYKGLKKAITTPNEFDPEVDKVKMIYFGEASEIVYLIQKFDEKLCADLQDGKLLQLKDKIPEVDDLTLKIIWDYLKSYVDPNLSNEINDRFAQAATIRLTTTDYKIYPERRRKFEELGKTDELIEFILKLNKGQIGGHYTDSFYIAVHNNFNKLFCQKLVPIYKKWENDKTIKLPDVDDFFTSVQNDVRFIPKRLEPVESINYVKTTASDYRNKTMGTNYNNNNRVFKPDVNKRFYKTSGNRNYLNTSQENDEIDIKEEHEENKIKKENQNENLNEKLKELTKMVLSLSKVIEDKT
ncbi:uncharacterized protein KGF55_002396 [Candida pseudojiufengensis]|uniref:uncharacterized protein n=1 Tax=Candida pseudojiufengensis TaxID=497109 RepID=UPI002225A38C|nr:uncharacterized protein KGF55_002396 [Candida pseudojiufengensis]KAI5963516.1 hypothetical protein KGF55_002396 [Candida pseudojiufengensis]